MKYFCTFLMSAFVVLPGLLQAAEPARPIDEASLETQTQKNKNCARCHSEDENEHQRMLGEHIRSWNPHTNELILCTDCHGKATAAHRTGDLDTIRFKSDAFPLDQRNGACMNCHETEVDMMRQKEWTHDVHFEAIGCASCHTLHTPIDAMQKILDVAKTDPPAARKARVKLCVDCHSDLEAIQEKYKDKEEGALQ